MWLQKFAPTILHLLFMLSSARAVTKVVELVTVKNQTSIQPKEVFVPEGVNLTLTLILPDKFAFSDAFFKVNNTILAKVSRSNGHNGNYNVTAMVFWERMNITYTSYSVSLHIFNVTRYESGNYTGKMSRLTPFEETFAPEDRQHQHSDYVDENYGDFRLKVRILVTTTIEVEPKVLVMNRPHYLICSENGGDPKQSTSWANLVDASTNKSTCLQYQPNSNYTQHDINRVSRAYLFHLNPENVVASKKGQLFVECELEQVWGNTRDIDHVRIQLDNIQHPPIFLAPEEKVLEWIPGQFLKDFEFISCPMVQDVKLNKMGEDCYCKLNFTTVDQSIMTFNLTDNSILQWRSVCNASNWFGNVTLQITNSVGSSNKVIVLLEEAVQQHDDDFELKWSYAFFILLFILIFIITCLIIGFIYYRKFFTSGESPPATLVAFNRIKSIDEVSLLRN